MARGEPAQTTRRWMVATAAVFALWLGATAGIAASSVLRNFAGTPPPIMLLIAVATLATINLAYSRFGSRLAAGVGVAGLVGYQVFRVVLEGVLWGLHRDGVIPVQMTFAGLNFDIISGIAAVPVAWLAARQRLPKWGLLLWNILGLLLLLNIVVVAILAAPLPFGAWLGFHTKPANTFIADAPFVWLPVVLVQAALFGHLLIFRRLRSSTGG